MSYDALLSPFRIGNVDIRNRVMMTAHVTNFATDDLASDRHVAYYGDRAKGGIGLIVMGFPGVHETSRNNAREIDGYTDAVDPRPAQDRRRGPAPRRADASCSSGTPAASRAGFGPSARSGRRRPSRAR